MKVKHKIIYSFVFPDNKRYIGQTCDMYNRMATHKSMYNAINLPIPRKVDHRRTGIGSAFEKFEWSKIRLEFLCVCAEFNANKREEYFMRKFNTLYPNGYNVLAERKSKQETK